MLCAHPLSSVHVAECLHRQNGANTIVNVKGVIGNINEPSQRDCVNHGELLDRSRESMEAAQVTEHKWAMQIEPR